jgi:predicted lipoprotein with Yx(FWY)xxD motif
MARKRPHTSLAGAAVIMLVALAFAACGDDDDDGGQATAAPPKTKSGSAATIGVETSGGLGKILADSQGRTIYLFEKDKGPTSTCSDECAVEWPPVTANGKPRVGNGLAAAKVGTTKRSDGSRQVTYNGHPLYLFDGDQSPGDVNGQGIDAFGALWYVVSPGGSEITTQRSSTGGNGGY